ncbi:MAG: excinuclease ABC subunit UvrC [Bacteroidota bacterium]
MIEISVTIRKTIKTLPDKPGVYQYFDKQGTIIYIGKAKSLKKRVRSYFKTDAALTGKLSVLVKKIVEIKYIIVDTEYDALLLENNLIKKYQPRYNVMLKDDKTYPWICIKNERFPRILVTRNLVKDGSEYFGPYASVRMMNTLLDLIAQLYPIRTCTYNLSKENIKQRKYKLCLKYHIGRCKGPCEGLQQEEEYNETIANIKEIIKGNINSVQQQLKKTMHNFATTYDFEKAQFVKEKIELLEKYQSKSTVVSSSITHVDVFSIIYDEQSAYVNFLKVVSGAIVQAHTVELKKKLDETNVQLLEFAITDLRERLNSNASEIIIPFALSIKIPDVKITVPQKGEKKKLLELSERNAKYFKLDKEKQKELVDPNRHVNRIMEQAMHDLHLPVLPNHIECFDNSNIQGSFAVAALVVFRSGRPAKNDYRHFNIKTVEGPNDFASMEEVVYRRYKRMLDENQPLPKLIVIDGGKGQLSSAVSSLAKLGLAHKIPIIGIAKKLEEIYFPGDSYPIYIDKKSETLKLIQQIRDEAHRFGITHHRNKRQKATLKSVLTDIDGIGYETAQKLLRKLKSVENISRASADELQAIVGKQKAEVLLNYFAKQLKHNL